MKSAATANTFGVSLDDLIGHISAIGITTRESGSIVGKRVADVKPFLIDLEVLMVNAEDDKGQVDNFILLTA